MSFYFIPLFWAANPYTVNSILKGSIEREIQINTEQITEVKEKSKNIQKYTKKYRKIQQHAVIIFFYLTHFNLNLVLTIFILLFVLNTWFYYISFNFLFCVLFYILLAV